VTQDQLLTLYEDAVNECQPTGMTQSNAARQRAVAPTDVNMPRHGPGQLHNADHYTAEHIVA